jgi:hypothetical protein
MRPTTIGQKPPLGAPLTNPQNRTLGWRLAVSHSKPSARREAAAPQPH